MVTAIKQAITSPGGSVEFPFLFPYLLLVSLSGFSGGFCLSSRKLSVLFDSLLDKKHSQPY